MSVAISIFIPVYKKKLLTYSFMQGGNIFCDVSLII